MKKITFALLTLLFTASPVLAVSTPSPTPKATPTLDPAKLAALVTKCDREDGNRLTALNNLTQKINATKKLSSSQKSALNSEVSDQVNQLTSLRSKINADTDMTTLRTDCHTIFSQHYIYAFFIPRDHRIVAADALLNAATLMNTLATKLQGYIATAKQQGADVTTLQSTLTDMQAKVTDASSKANAVITTLIALTYAGYPGNKGTISDANTQLSATRADLRAARNDAHAIINGLHKILDKTGK